MTRRSAQLAALYIAAKRAGLDDKECRRLLTERDADARARLLDRLARRAPQAGRATLEAVR